MLGVRTLAMVLFLLIGGVVADRFSRIVVLQVSHVLTCLTQALAASLIITGNATLTQLTVIEGVNGAVSAFTMPAIMGVVPLVVDRTKLQQANALLSFSRSSLSIIGPAIAGLLVVGVGPGWALAVDALTYAVAIVCLTRVGLPRRSEEAAPDGTRCCVSCARAGASSPGASGSGSSCSPSGSPTPSTPASSACSGRSSRSPPRPSGRPVWGLVLSAEAAGTVIMTIVMLRLSSGTRCGRACWRSACWPSRWYARCGTRAPARRHRLLPRRRSRGGLRCRLEHGPPRARAGGGPLAVSSYDALGSFVAIPIGTFLYGWLATTVDLETLHARQRGVYVVISLSALLSRRCATSVARPREPVGTARSRPPSSGEARRWPATPRSRASRPPRLAAPTPRAESQEIRVDQGHPPLR